MTKVWTKDLQDPVLNETAWEREMQFAGLDRFERGRDDKEAAETAGGMKLTRLMIKRGTEAIEAMQKRLLGITRVTRELRSTVLLVPADTAALLTIKSMISAAYSPEKDQDGVNFQIVVVETARAVENELNFLNWLQSSKEAAKAYAEANGLSRVPTSQALRLLQESGTDKRNIRRWKNAFAELSAYKWDSLEEHYCGEALVTTVVEALPEFFEIIEISKMGKRRRQLRLTDEARRTLEQHEIKVAALQAIKKPMLARPKKWTREDYEE